MVKDRFKDVIVILLFTLLWAIQRYSSGGHLVYHAHADTWWVQNGTPMAHYDAGDFSPIEALLRNLKVFLKEGRKAFAIGFCILIGYLILTEAFKLYDNSSYAYQICLGGSVNRKELNYKRKGGKSSSSGS